MAAAVYTHHDVAGPGLNLTGNNLERLKQILIPCLVNGYSGRQAAGWSLVQNLATGFSLERAVGGIINFTRPPTNVYGLQVYLAESLTSISGSPPAGQNLRSGPYSASSNPSEANRHWISFFDQYVVAGWLLLATPTAFLLQIRLSTDVNDAQYQRVINFFAGSAKLHSGLTGVQNMMALGGQIALGTFTGASIYNYIFENGYTILRDPLTGAAVSGAGTVIAAAPSLFQQVAGYTSPLVDALPPTLRLNPLHLYISGLAYVGYLPGVLLDNVIGKYVPSSLMTSMGFSPTLEAWTAPKELNGYRIWPMPTAWGLLFFTDDPGAW